MADQGPKRVYLKLKRYPLPNNISTTTSMLPSAADATTSAHSGQEDDVVDQLHRSSQASLPAIASYPLETQSDGAERDNPTISARFVPGVGRLLPSHCNRLLADALKHSVFELRKDDEARMSR